MVQTQALTAESVRRDTERYLKSALKRDVDPSVVVAVLGRAFGLHPAEQLIMEWLEEWDAASRIENNPNPSDWERLIPDEVPYSRGTDWLLDYATELYASCDWTLGKIVAS